MKKLGGLAKGAAKGAAKEAMTTALSAAVKEILDETGAKEIAKDQLMDAGKKILGDNSIPTKQKLSASLMKALIKKELGI